jgi:hypothetical protein
MNIPHYIIKSLKHKAESEKAQALASLEILTHKTVGIGEHTTEGIFEDLDKALDMLVHAEDKLKAIDKYLNGKDIING